MFSVQPASTPTSNSSWTRRELMRIGGLGLAGLSLPQLLQTSTISAADSVPNRRAKARSCILLFLVGGPPQHSTWDPKPDAAAEVRGEFGPISTNVDGIRICELLPRTSLHMDKIAILRGVSTGDNAHSSSGYYMLTGRPHSPMNRENANPGAPNDWPNLGSVVNSVTKSTSELPAAVRLPTHIYNTDGSVWPGQDGGFLGQAVDPWLFRCEPASKSFHVPQFTLPLDVDLLRIDHRHRLLRAINRQLDHAGGKSGIEEYDALTQRAFGLLSSSMSRAAFQLEAESQQTRQRYGMTQFGQSVLLARRLIEAGVRLVQVNWFRGPEEPSDAPVWDSHVNEAARLKSVLAPPFDHALSALLQDLADRRILDETLVVCLGEFGRTPRFNPRAGRDHWGPVFSVALAGGGIRGGTVYGASDRIGAYVQDGLVRPEDLNATILNQLGVSVDTEIIDAQKRPIPVSRGHVLAPILS